MVQTRQRVYTDDIFDGVLACLVLRGYESIHPGKVRLEPDKIINSYRYFDQACQAVYIRVKQECERRDIRCNFSIFLDEFFGNSDTCSQIISSWLSSRLCYARIPGDGYIYFNISKDRAERILDRMCSMTTFRKEFYEELAELFLRVYNN